MSTSKNIDKICIVAIALTLAVCLIFMCGSSFGIAAMDHVMGYETRLFDTERVHSIDIVMDDWNEFIESCEDEEYVVCTAVIDGEKFSNIGIRAKGNTSLSSVKSSGSQRYSFKIEFDQYEKGKSYHGLDKLCLNNLIQDNTMMKDYVSYVLMEDFGADSPLCSFTYITVNGEDWGLYLAVEGIEDAFLERNYGSDAGELYKPDSMSFGGGRGNGRGFNMDDFDFSEDGNFEMPDMDDFEMPDMGDFDMPDRGNRENRSEDFRMPGGMQMPQGGGQMPSFDPESGGFGGRQQEDSEPSERSDGSFDFGEIMKGGFGGGGFGMGSDDVKLQYIDDDPDSYPNIFNNAKTDVSKADEKRLIKSLKDLSSYENLEEVLDMDEVLRYFVVHVFLCNGDSYTGSMIHNYYLHESDGKLGMIPWDYNLAFGTFQGGDGSSSVNADIDSPVSGSMDDRPMVGWIFSDDGYNEMYHELFAEFIDKWFSDGQLEEMIENTYELIKPYVEKDPTKFCSEEDFESGVTALKQFVKLRGEAVEKQLAGDDTAVDTTGLNVSDMGTMGGGMGGPGSRDPQNSGEMQMPQGGGQMPSFGPGTGGSGNFERKQK